MNAVDKYVVYDDVNFIKGGWINRNRILVDGQPKYFNIPMLGASPNKLINQVEVNSDVRLINKNIRMIENTYKKAPYYDEVYPLIEKILKCGKPNLAEYIIDSLKIINEYLNITTELIVSSLLKKENNLKAQDKVLAICELLEATEYYNAVGGQDLYSFKAFKMKNIQLKFLKTEDIVYEQCGKEFQSNLSIVDIMMFNSKEKIKDMLNSYSIITE